MPPCGRVGRQAMVTARSGRGRKERIMRRPRFVAQHARNARGLLGQLIAFIMARETWHQNLRVGNSFSD